MLNHFETYFDAYNVYFTVEPHQFLYPRYEVYRGYIVFAFSVIMFVGLSVCLFVCKLFSVKDFSATTLIRILKFGTKLESDELYCVTNKQPQIAYQSLYVFIFLSLQWKFLSQISQLPLEPVFSNFVYTFRKGQSVLCKWELRCSSSFCLLYSIFHFFLLSLLCNTYGHFFLSKISQQLLELGF